MTIKNFAFVLLFTALAFGCKKKDNSPQTPAPYTPPADGSVSRATYFHGIFISGVSAYQVAPGVIYESINCRAWTGSKPAPGITPDLSVKAGKITLNGDSLMYSAFSKYYQQDFNVQVNLDTEVWAVEGGNGIPAFTHTCNTATPEFTGEQNFPDSISKSAGVNIKINNVGNMNYGVIYILDDGNNLGGAATFELKAGNNDLNFTPTQLSVLKNTTNGMLLIILRNNSAYVYGSKDFQFQRENQFNKKVKIKS